MHVLTVSPRRCEGTSSIAALSTGRLLVSAVTLCVSLCSSPFVQYRRGPWKSHRPGPQVSVSLAGTLSFLSLHGWTVLSELLWHAAPPPLCYSAARNKDGEAGLRASCQSGLLCGGNGSCGSVPASRLQAKAASVLVFAVQMRGGSACSHWPCRRTVMRSLVGEYSPFLSQLDRNGVDLKSNARLTWDFIPL